MRSYETQFINGQFSATNGDTTFEVVNPATEKVIGRVTSATLSDVETAVAAANAAFETWSVTPRAERLDVLKALAGEIERRADDLAAVICEEVGTPIGEARQLQVGLAQLSLQTNIDVLENFDADAYTQIANSHVFREPVGVVAGISPWNYPLLLSMTKIAPALAAGCTLVHKPSEVTPLNTLLFAEITATAGVPAGVYNVLIGSGPAIGEPLVTHPDVDMVAFTGSTRAGRRVYELASGPVVSKVQQERVRHYIQSAIDEGARVAAGGPQQPTETPEGYYIAGTVLSNVNPLMTVAKEEIFGPVVCLMPYDTEEEAIRIANDTDYGLHGGVFSGDVEHATTVARRLRTGRVDINGAQNNLDAPFGGYRQSGIGREFGRAGFEEFLETKSIQY